MRLAKLASCALTAAVMAGVSACGDENKETSAGVVVYDDLPETANGTDRSEDLGIAHAFVFQAGFAGGQAIQFLDLGDVNPTPPKVYVLTKGGTPLAGQYPIIDTLPGNADYGAYWQVVTVAVDGDYKANDIKSLKGLESAGFKMTETDDAVHCAVVNPDATFVTADLSAALNVFVNVPDELQNNPYFDPEQDIADGNRPGDVIANIPVTDGDIVLEPVWHKRLKGFCYTEGFDVTVPLTITDGVAEIDTSGLGQRFDVGGLPVFERGPDAADYSPLVVAVETVSDVPGQPGSIDDVDAGGGEAVGLVDNPILGTLDVDRFELTITNTTEATLPVDVEVPFGPGALLVADGFDFDADGDPETDDATAYLWSEGLAPSAELLAFIAGDSVPLYTTFPGQVDPFAGSFADFQQLGPLAPGESVTVIVTATPFHPALSVTYTTPSVPGSFAGAAGELYDDAGPVATASLDISMYEAGVTVEQSATFADPVGTVTITYLAP